VNEPPYALTADTKSDGIRPDPIGTAIISAFVGGGLERIAGEEPDLAAGREVMAMLRRLDQDIVEARRGL
jgi:hypothetical protein